VKKKDQVNESVYKQVFSQKERREFTISDRVKRANSHQHNADFVASQQRVYNTKGKESELAKVGERLPEDGGYSAAKASDSANTLAKAKAAADKVDADQSARLESIRLAQKKLQRPSSTPLVIASILAYDPAAPEVKIDGPPPSGADAVALTGDTPQGGLASQADMGHHVSATAGSASLDGNVLDKSISQAEMGHQAIKEAGNASIKGRSENPSATHFGNARATEVASLVEMVDTPTEGFEKSLVANRLDGRQPSVEGSVDLPGEAPKNGLSNQAELGHHASADADKASLDGKASEQTAGQAAMGHHVSTGAGTASLDGKASEQTAGQAAMGHHVSTGAGTASLDGKASEQTTGQAAMGHHVSTKAGTASLGGKTVDQTHSQTGMGHQESKKSSQVSLKGSDKASVSSSSMAHTEKSQRPLGNVAGAAPAADVAKSSLQSRLAEKMSKIRSKTDDITTESDVLHKSNHKP
jgi:hypothetical protein